MIPQAVLHRKISCINIFKHSKKLLTNNLACDTINMKDTAGTILNKSHLFYL